MPPPALTMDRLTRDFGAVRALDSLSLEVETGSVFGFLGPNGSGKTTAIRLLLGLLEPSGGRAEVLGLDTRTAADKIRQRSGALLEHSGLYERLSAEANLEFFARAWRLPRPARRARIRELLDQFGLWDRRAEPAGHWSRGMKQKLAVARALLHRPELIFLDEPTAGLDPIAAVALRADIMALAARERVTVFVTTHNLAEAEKMCGRLGVVRAGRLLAVGSPDELRRLAGEPRIEIRGRGFEPPLLRALLARPEVRDARLADGGLLVELGGDAPAAPLIRMVVEAGAEIEEVRRSRATLEDAFLELMERAA